MVGLALNARSTSELSAGDLKQLPPFERNIAPGDQMLRLPAVNIGKCARLGQRRGRVTRVGRCLGLVIARPTAQLEASTTQLTSRAFRMNGRVADMIVITFGAALMQSRQSCAGCDGYAFAGDFALARQTATTRKTHSCLAADLPPLSSPKMLHRARLRATTRRRAARELGRRSSDGQSAVFDVAHLAGMAVPASPSAGGVIVVLALGALGYLSARAESVDKPKADVAAKAPDSNRANAVVLSDSQLQMVNVGTVSEYTFPLQREAVGSIDFNEDMAAQVFPPYQGRIVKLFAMMGDNVSKRGQPLLTIESPDLIQAEST
jgi:biotin carboxyl carrier protein